MVRLTSLLDFTDKPKSFAMKVKGFPVYGNHLEFSVSSSFKNPTEDLILIGHKRMFAATVTASGVRRLIHFISTISCINTSCSNQGVCVTNGGTLMQKRHSQGVPRRP